MKTFKDLSEKLKKDKDDPCWKGYVQLGTKKKNGKEVPNCVPKEEKEIEEKSVSKAQQRFMGMVRAKQKGEMPDASPEVSKAAASMSKKDVKDFAKTKHKGLPNKVDEGPDYLGDLRRKKEREERKKASQHAGETDRQKTMRKVYGKAMGGLKKGYGESVELDEAKISVGDRVTLKPNKSVLDRSFIGKAGVVTNMLDGEAMVKFANGRTIAVSPRHLTVNESVDLDEGRNEALKALERLVKTGGIDRATFQKAYDLYKGAKFKELKTLISRSDTDPSEAIADVIQRHDSKAFNSMYPRAKSGDYLRNITRMESMNESEDDPFYRKKVHRDPKKMRAIAQMDRDSRKKRYDDDEKHLSLQKGKFDADAAAFKYGTTYGDDFKPTKQEVDQINKFFRSNASDKQKKVVYKRLMSRHTSKDMRKKTMDLIKSGQRDMFEAMNFFEFREALKEAKGSNYQIYHKTYSAAVQHAINHVFDKMGYEVDSQDFFNKVSSGPRKPSPGKTNSFSIDLFDKRTAKPVRQKLHMQVYGMDNGKYELNMYVA